MHVDPVHNSMLSPSAEDPIGVEAWSQQPEHSSPSHDTSRLSESPEAGAIPGIIHQPHDESTLVHYNEMGIREVDNAVLPSFSHPEGDDELQSNPACLPAGLQHDLATQDDGKMCMSWALSTNMLT